MLYKKQDVLQRLHHRFCKMHYYHTYAHHLLLIRVHRSYRLRHVWNVRLLLNKEYTRSGMPTNIRMEDKLSLLLSLHALILLYYRNNSQIQLSPHLYKIHKHFLPNFLMLFFIIITIPILTCPINVFVPMSISIYLSLLKIRFNS